MIQKRGVQLDLQSNWPLPENITILALILELAAPTRCEHGAVDIALAAGSSGALIGKYPPI
jgi:hypothetical protein